MAFENLSERLQNTIAKLTGKGKVTETDVKEMMREVRLALLEADVNFKVVKDFVKKISERAVGVDVMKSLTPAQQIVKIVNEELVELLGGNNSELVQNNKKNTVMMVGLQGAGKTTTAGKLALKAKKTMKKRPLLIAADVYRPAAVQQLQTLGKQLDIPVFYVDKNPVDIVKDGLNYAEENNLNYIIIDTAGRLHIDEELMTELQDIKAAVKPQEILLVVDSMIGQEAVNIATSFNEQLDISGLVLTKLDGDTRGGAALSIKSITGKPIKLIGMGEKMNDLEYFHPERMASRILGMGDVLTLIEKAQASIDEDEAKKMQEKILTQNFTFEDFLSQLNQMKKLGSIKDILGMLPGMNKVKGVDLSQIDEKQFTYIEAIIQSMTIEERQNPDIINVPRRNRISKGSGRPISEVHKLIKQFEEMRKMMKQFGGMVNNKSKRKGIGRLLGGKLPF
ncbi:MULTISPECIES: signal recognition particle protein [unclassified Gemella]|uniref:signal recognition particle protein n=1 Tax=unclassified Gemella TaxID=2624949 RepID=UPI0015D03190|nr:MULTISPECIES: signal recognition particle protein [unclassified Gemella]MBF0710551.1 signal recognition particle protein [Gemella sp. GL1.1]NYS27895.1 signal recognition particle protein [Gemella sp. GL1]